MKATPKKINENNIALGKNGLTREIHNLEMKNVKIMCLSCVLDHEVRMIRQKKKLMINKNKIVKIKR